MTTARLPLPACCRWRFATVWRQAGAACGWHLGGRRHGRLDLPESGIHSSCSTRWCAGGRIDAGSPKCGGVCRSCSGTRGAGRRCRRNDRERDVAQAIERAVARNPSAGGGSSGHPAGRRRCCSARADERLQVNGNVAVTTLNRSVKSRHHRDAVEQPARERLTSACRYMPG